jgi:predicted aminopeptidase
MRSLSHGRVPVLNQCNPRGSATGGSWADSSTACGLPVRALARALALVLALVQLPGCYVLHLAGGQLGLVNDQEPIEEALAREPDPRRRALLAEVPGIHAFGEAVVGLKRSDSYVGYYAIQRPWLTLVLSAAPRDRLAAYTRWYPIAGRVPYRSFFDEERAKEAQRELEAMGYDTYLHHSPAYSTLGFFRDPVTTPMLDRGPACPPPAIPERLDRCRLAGLAETLLHELTHQTLYVPGQTTFNEQLASFVGRTAMVQFLSARGIYDEALRARLAVAFGRQRALEAEAAQVTKELDALYASPLSFEQKLARREPLFRALAVRAAQIYPDTRPESWTFNNARLLQYRRYNRAADTMRKTFEEAGGNWQRFWQLVSR